MQAIRDDVRQAFRQLAKSPGFAITVLLTLVIGIGATTAIFTLVYDVLLKPLPYNRPHQLVVLQEQVAEFRDIYPTLPMNANHFVFWQKHSKSFQSMALMQQLSMPLGVGGHPLEVSVAASTPGIFSVLDTMPMMGRAFSAEEDQPGHEHVVVLMNGLWRNQFSSDPAVVGKTVTLNGFPYTVIGVMPPSFHLPQFQTLAVDHSRSPPIQALLPMALDKERLQDAMGDFDYFGLARLQPGVTAAAANAEVNALQRSIMDSLSAQEKATLSATAIPFQQALVGDNRRPLLILLMAVGGLLLVGCVNIANLLLARAVDRRQQMAVIAALGASRRDMLRVALRETAVLAMLGGAFGLGLAMLILPAMQRLLPPALDFRGSLHLDWAGAACAVLLAMFCTLLAGATPAWMISRTPPQDVLHSESRLATESRKSKQMRKILVSAEIALSVVLVFMTGLVTTSLYRLMHIDRGFSSDRILTATVAMPSKSYDEKPARAAFYRQAVERLAALPGVEHAAAVSQLPLSSDAWIDIIHIPGDPRPIMQLPTEHFRWISPGYFETLHLPLVRGRLLQPGDEGKHYALISELTARTLWPGVDAIGRQFKRAGLMEEEPFTVIGVVGNARTVSLASPDPMMVYMPYWYRSDRDGALVMRTRQDPAAMAEALRKTIWSVDGEVSVPEVRLLGGVVTDSVADRRFETQLLLLFAVSSFLLAGLGVYGVVTYSVAQRQREIGLRVALGAQRKNIYTLVLHDGLTPVLLGALGGVVVSLALARVVRSLLFEISPYNATITAGAVSLLAMVGVAACLVPARRAAQADPMHALRRE